MKKLSLIILLFSIFQGLNAQEEENSNKYVLGGSINFLSQSNSYPFSAFSINSGIGGLYSNSTNDIKNSIFAITPYFGKEINSHWLAGLQLDYRRGNYKAESSFVIGQSVTGEFERKSNQIGFGVFTRYMVNPENKVIFFIQPSVEYNILKEDEFFDSALNQEEKATYFEARVNLGIVYNINDKVRATLRTGGLLFVSGKWEVLDTDIENDFTSFSANLNLTNVSFGFELRI